MAENNRDIVFYDGECGFCLGWVKFLINRDKHRKLYFATRGGETFLKQLTEEQIKALPDSIVLKTSDNRVLVKSDAVIEMLSYIGTPYNSFSRVLGFIPKFFRDFCYSVIARFRKSFFLKKSSVCPLVSKEDLARFLP